MKKLKKIAIIIIVILAVVALDSYIYHRINVSQEIKGYQPVGKLYEVDHHMMHIYTGGSGDVTVVFAAGWGSVNPYVDYAPLYEGVSQYARFAVYDRFGYGYSEMTDKKRDIDTIVSEIHTL